MMTEISKSKIRRRAIFVAALLASAVSGASLATAGECPADKVGVDVTKPGASTSSGVEDVVLSAIDLAKTPIAAKGYQLRIRRLTVQPGGVVAWHSHAERPSNIYIIDGSITEYRSTCAAPIEHKAGEVVAEVGGIQHWWRNNTDKPTVLTSSDLFHDKMGDNHVM